jgi:hypothetical protein
VEHSAGGRQQLGPPEARPTLLASPSRFPSWAAAAGLSSTAMSTRGRWRCPYIICGTDDRQSTSTTELGPRPYLADVAALLATVIEAARQ